MSWKNRHDRSDEEVARRTLGGSASGAVGSVLRGSEELFIPVDEVASLVIIVAHGLGRLRTSNRARL